MSEADAGIVEYLQGHRIGVLATTNRSGQPQQTLIAYHFDGRDFAVSTRAPTLKARNIRRRPEVSLAVVDGPRQVIVYGSARVIDDAAEVLRLHQQRIRQIALREESDAELAERLRREERVVLLLAPRRFYPPTLAQRP